MTPSARLSALIELIDALHAEWQQPQPRPAEQILKAYTSQRRYIGGGDRRALQESLFSFLRSYGAAKAACEAEKLPLTGRSLTLMHLAQRGEEVSALCQGGKYAPDSVTSDEWRALKEAQSTKHKARLPQWLEIKLHEQYGAETEALIAALMQPAPVDLRVNLLKTTSAKALAALKAEGIDATPIIGLPAGLTVSGRSIALTNTKAYQEGWIEIQDRGSQAVIEALLGYLQPEQGRGGDSRGVWGGISPSARSAKYKHQNCSR
jgi:16S rRNA (cytosine967-C5)-methyltransferase